MTTVHFAPLPDRAVLRIGGPEKHDFLQGLITNDIEKLSPEQAVYAALLTPQGKIIADFFLAQEGDTILLDCDAAMSAALFKRLTMYKLRAQVTIEAVPDLSVTALFGDGADALAGRIDGATVFADPRYAALGTRVITPDVPGLLASLGGDVTETDADAYKAHRLSLGIAEGSGELGTEQMFALEANLAELNGVDFQKGCYVGQEVTARMKHKTTLRKRIVPLTADGPFPDAPAPVKAGDREIGTLCASRDTSALALLRLDRLDAARSEGITPSSGDTTVTPQNPPWLTIL